jgi:hypothetical protein
VRTARLLQEFKWQLFDHVLCSPDLATTNPHIKTFLASLNFADGQELNSAVVHWWQRPVTGDTAVGASYDKQLSSNSDYVEKRCNVPVMLRL